MDATTSTTYTTHTLNIVELIENNPITRLSNTYQSKLLTKIKSEFKDEEQQMFVASFYCFLNYNPRNDFVIDLDNVWKWLGFQSKFNAKRLLETFFNLDIDYKKSLLNTAKQSEHVKGGHNKETILLNVRTFKLFCLKAGTKKADQIHEYYVKLEETLQEVLQQESNELKLQLENKNIEIQNTTKDKNKIREKTLLEQFPNNTQCVYYGIIDNLSDKKEKLIKFGNSNNLKNRVIKHKETYSNFQLINAFKVENKLQIENAIKEHPLFIERQRSITLKNKKYIELINIDGLKFTDLDKTIKEILTNIEYSPENYIKILDENKLLKKQLEEKESINNTNAFILLTAENNRLKSDNLKLIKKYNSICSKNSTYTELEPLEPEPTINDKDIENYGIIINKLHKDFTKNTNGTYNIEGQVFKKLYGTREEVWDGTSYKTTGYLIKKDLMLNKLGKIVSKKKAHMETLNKRFETFGVNAIKKEKEEKEDD